MPSTLERWTGAAWSNEANLVRFKLTDKTYFPMFLFAVIADPENTIQSNYGNFTRIRIIESNTSRIIFYGKVISIDVEYDPTYGQIIKLKVRDNLQELLSQLNNTNYTGDVQRSEIVADIVDEYIFTVSSTPNIATGTTGKFVASAVTEAAGVLATNFEDSGKNVVRSIFEIAREDPHDANRTGFGAVFYLDQEFSGNDPTPDLHYFRRGDRPGDLADNSGGNADTYGLTVEYSGSEGNQDRQMFADYEFPQFPKELVTKVRIQYVDEDGASLTLPVILVNHGAVAVSSFAIGNTVTWAGGGSANIELINDTSPRYLLLGPSSTGSTAYLVDVSGLLMTDGTSGATSTANATSATPPGSIRETIEQDVEVTIRDYGIEHLTEARTRAAQILFNGGDTITRGKFRILNWPFIIRSGTGIDHDGPNNSATLIHTAGNFLRYGVRPGDIIENLTDVSTATITAVTNTVITGTLTGGTDNDWDTDDLYRFHVMTRAGHIIRVKNSNHSIDADMIVTQIEYDEGPASAFATIEVLGNATTRGGGPPEGPIQTIKRDVEIGMWQTVGASGGVAISSQVVNLSFTGAAFVATDDDDITWGAGTATFSDGTTQTFLSGSATLAALSYIYIELGNTTLQVTTAFSAAVGINNALIAIAQNNATSTEDALIISVNAGSPQLVAGTFFANEISAFSANMGLLTTGAIRIPSGTANTVTTAGFTGFTINGDRIAGYNAGVLQVEMRSTDGAIQAGAGAVIIDVDGMELTSNTPGPTLPGISARLILTETSTGLSSYISQSFDSMIFQAGALNNIVLSGVVIDINASAGASDAIRLDGNVSVGASNSFQATTVTTNNIAPINVVGGGIDIESAAFDLEPFDASDTFEMRFLELSANGGNYVGFEAPDAISSNIIWTLPNSDGSADQVLITNASATLSWDTVSRIATGTYTGDGATSLAITGVGFQPKYVQITVRKTAFASAVEAEIVWTTDVIIDDNAAGMALRNGGDGAGWDFFINGIIALGSDGFTVDDAGADAHPNKNTTVYNYLAIG